MEQAALDAITIEQGVSIIGLFWKTDLVTKFILITLIIASVWTWAVIFEKIGIMTYMKKSVRAFEKKFWSGGSLDSLFDSLKKSKLNPMSSVFVAAMKEWHRAGIYSKGDKNSLKNSGLLERIERVMYITADKEKEKMEKRMIYLATTGAVAPFVGLFGTVWGIMDSFYAIGVAGNAHLAVIAPGLAEALLTTILGLIAAIPSVIAYNMFARWINRMDSANEYFIGEFIAILSRKIDEAGK